ncbi:shikimate kinase [Magnetovibrio sp.]|uniref:shikimate kinase n=1 Tax=Magnetovibrio sp. TaxID=2024836 RepID=UPI002F9355CE
MNIIIIGMRGAGKSNVSRRLAVLTKRPVLSSDTLIEYENGGKTIAQIISDNNGDWRAFRDMEFEVIRKIAAMDGVIVDCGGGVIVDLDADGNEVFSTRKVEALKKNGTIIWLKGDIKRLVEKVKDKAERPTLDLTRSAEELMRRRLPFYEKAADIVINIDGKKRPEMAESIVKMFKDQL